MYYRLNSDIYLVSGAKYSCIYDVPHNKLHKIGKGAYELLQKAVSGVDISNTEEITFMEALVSMQIAHQSDKTTGNYKSIDEVYSYERKLDFAWIEITNRCNLKCIHCYNEHSECSKTSMSLHALSFC